MSEHFKPPQRPLSARNSPRSAVAANIYSTAPSTAAAAAAAPSTPTPHVVGATVHNQFSSARLALRNHPMKLDRAVERLVREPPILQSLPRPAISVGELRGLTEAGRDAAWHSAAIRPVSSALESHKAFLAEACDRIANEPAAFASYSACSEQILAEVRAAVELAKAKEAAIADAKWSRSSGGGSRRNRNVRGMTTSTSTSVGSAGRAATAYDDLYNDDDDDDDDDDVETAEERDTRLRRQRMPSRLLIVTATMLLFKLTFLLETHGPLIRTLLNEILKGVFEEYVPPQDCGVGSAFVLKEEHPAVQDVDCSFLLQLPVYFDEILAARDRASAALRSSTQVRLSLLAASMVAGKVVARSIDERLKQHFVAWRKTAHRLRQTRDAIANIGWHSQRRKLVRRVFLAWRLGIALSREQRMLELSARNSDFLTGRTRELGQRIENREVELTRQRTLKESYILKGERLEDMLSTLREDTVRVRAKLLDAEARARGAFEAATAVVKRLEQSHLNRAATGGMAALELEGEVTSKRLLKPGVQPGQRELFTQIQSVGESRPWRVGNPQGFLVAWLNDVVDRVNLLGGIANFAAVAGAAANFAPALNSVAVQNSGAPITGIITTIGGSSSPGGGGGAAAAASSLRSPPTSPTRARSSSSTRGGPGGGAGAASTLGASFASTTAAEGGSEERQQRQQLQLLPPSIAAASPQTGLDNARLNHVTSLVPDLCSGRVYCAVMVYLGMSPAAMAVHFDSEGERRAAIVKALRDDGIDCLLRPEDLAKEDETPHMALVVSLFARYCALPSTLAMGPVPEISSIPELMERTEALLRTINSNRRWIDMHQILSSAVSGMTVQRCFGVVKGASMTGLSGFTSITITTIRTLRPPSMRFSDDPIEDEAKCERLAVSMQSCLGALRGIVLDAFFYYASHVATDSLDPYTLDRYAWRKILAENRLMPRKSQSTYSELLEDLHDHPGFPLLSTIVPPPSPIILNIEDWLVAIVRIFFAKVEVFKTPSTAVDVLSNVFRAFVVEHICKNVSMLRHAEFIAEFGSPDLQNTFRQYRDPLRKIYNELTSTPPHRFRLDMFVHLATRLKVPLDPDVELPHCFASARIALRDRSTISTARVDLAANRGVDFNGFCALVYVLSQAKMGGNPFALKGSTLETFLTTCFFVHFQGRVPLLKW